MSNLFLICHVLALELPAAPAAAISTLDLQILYAEDMEPIHHLDMEYRLDDPYYRPEFFEPIPCPAGCAPHPAAPPIHCPAGQEPHFRVAPVYIAGLRARRAALYHSTIAGLINT